MRSDRAGEGKRRCRFPPAHRGHGPEGCRPGDDQEGFRFEQGGKYRPRLGFTGERQDRNRLLFLREGTDRKPVTDTAGAVRVERDMAGRVPLPFLPTAPAAMEELRWR